MPSGSKEHHLGILEEWGLIEEIGRTTESGGIPERVFDLIDEGRGFVEEHLTEQGKRPDSYELRVERLEDDVDRLHTKNKRLGSEVAELREELRELEKTDLF